MSNPDLPHELILSHELTDALGLRASLNERRKEIDEDIASMDVKIQGLRDKMAGLWGFGVTTKVDPVPVRVTLARHILRFVEMNPQGVRLRDIMQNVADTLPGRAPTSVSSELTTLTENRLLVRQGTPRSYVYTPRKA